MVDVNGGQIDLGRLAGADGRAELRVVLRWLRRERGLSQRDLTVPLNLAAHSAIVDYESGRRIPSHNILAAYEEYFGLPNGSLQALRGRALADRAAAEAQHELSTVPGFHHQKVEIPRPARHLPLAQLPPDARDFTGREAELRYVLNVVRTIRPATLTVSGPPAVGKTAFAIRLAHMLAGRFPDGQLFADLHAPRSRYVASSTVLGRFLRALGVAADELPASLSERSCMFRSVMVGARALVLLDNVASEAQVRPLLSAGSECMTIITSRSVLSGLEGAKGVILDVLSVDEALQLFRRVIGDRRAAAEDPAARAVVRLCAGLPLAIRIAGARLAARPAWPVGELARRLADDRCRLAELAAGDLDVRAAFGPSYHTLDPAARRVFRQLGPMGAVSFTIEQAAAVAGLSLTAVQPILEHLADLSLVQPIAPGRYRMHDLLRLYSAECGRDEDETRPEPNVVRSRVTAGS